MRSKFWMPLLFISLLLTACSGKEQADVPQVQESPQVKFPEPKEFPKPKPFPEPKPFPLPKEFPKLKEFPKVQVSTTDKQVKVDLPDTLLFDFNKSDLKPEAREVLDQIAQACANYPSAKIHISGHTDDQGSDQYNLTLSQKRAEAVEAYLKAKVDAVNFAFTTKGYGETRPVAPNDTEENRQKNRRVEIVIEPGP